MIRWKAVVPALVTGALVVVFAVFFLDWTVEWGMERAGTAMNGARVDLAGVDISWRQASITLRGLAVTDRAAPMTNALEVETMSFQLAVKPLFWRKVVIENGEITGVRTGTPRRSSGAVRLKEEKPANGKKEEAGKKEAKKPLLPTADLKAQFDPGKIRAEDLSSYRMCMEEKSRITAAAGGWERTADGIDVDARAAEATAFLERIKGTSYSGAEGVKNAAGDLKEARRLQAGLKALQDSVSAAKKSIEAETAAAKGTVGRVNAAKKADADAALAKFGIGSFSTEGITKAVIGPVWMGRIESGLYWFRRIRGMMPPKKAVPPPRTGRDIAFRFHYKWPAFHLKKAAVSGVTSGTSPLSWSGTLRDVTSDPALVGRPIVLDLKGSGKGQSMTLRAVLDYTKEKARETVAFRYAGLDLAGVRMGDLGGPVAIGSGRATLRLDLTTSGESVKGTVDFDGQPVALTHDMTKEAAAQKLYSLLHGTITGLKRLQVTVLVGGKLLAPSFGVKSSMDGAFKSAVGEMMKKESDAARAKAQARIDELVDGEKGKLASVVGDKSAKALGKLGVKAGSLNSVQGRMDGIIEDLKKKGTAAATGGAGGMLKKLKR